MAESVTFTLTPEIVKKLNDLVKASGENKSECMRRLINDEWDRAFVEWRKVELEKPQ